MIRIVDSHLHVWRLPAGDGDSPYAWITPDKGVLYRDFQPEEAGAELAGSGVTGAVLVQADDTLADTAMMLRTCDQFPWAVGVVGWVPLDQPQEAAAALDRWQQHPAFRGVRHLVHDDPRADFLDLPPVRESLALLARREVPLDVPDAWPRHLAQVAGLVEDMPELTLVVDHLAKPPLDQGPGAAAFEEWERLMRRIARAPRTVAKVSGLRIPGSHYDAATVRPAVEVALEAFGPDRLMYGGDWPMTVPDGGYAPTLEVLQEVLSGLSADEADAIWHGTAERVYRL